MTFKHLGVKSNFGVFRFITSDEKGQSTYWVESYASEKFYKKNTKYISRPLNSREFSRIVGGSR